jgi:hypothetical protein
VARCGRPGNTGARRTGRRAPFGPPQRRSSSRTMTAMISAMIAMVRVVTGNTPFVVCGRFQAAPDVRPDYPTSWTRRQTALSPLETMALVAQCRGRAASPVSTRGPGPRGRRRPRMDARPPERARRLGGPRRTAVAGAGVDARRVRTSWAAARPAVRGGHPAQRRSRYALDRRCSWSEAWPRVPVARACVVAAPTSERGHATGSSVRQSIAPAAFERLGYQRRGSAVEACGESPRGR